MKIEIWSDIVCPFCYIGKRNLESALEHFPGKEKIEIEWKSFQLDPTVPHSGVQKTYTEYLAQKRGWSTQQTLEAFRSVTESARAAGLEYHLENASVLNTFDIHRIIQLAKTKGLGDQAEEIFFKAYFTEGKNIADKKVQIELLEKMGLTEQDLDTALTEDVYQKAVQADIDEAIQIGVRGVPFFVFNRKYAVSGAQPPQAILETIESAFSEWRQQHPEQLQVTEGQSCDVNGTCL